MKDYLDWVFDIDRKPGDHYDAVAFLETVTSDLTDLMPNELPATAYMEWETRMLRRMVGGQVREHAEAEALAEIVNIAQGRKDRA